MKTNTNGGKTLPYLLLFFSLIFIGAGLIGSIVESITYVPYIPLGIGFLFLAVFILKEKKNNILNISSLVAFAIAIILGVIYWKAAYIQFLIVFVVGFIIYVLFKRKKFFKKA